MTELVTLKQEHQTAASLYGDTVHLTELFEAVRKVAPWANDRKQPMSAPEIALVVRKAVAMGLDPLNAHEVQIWKDNRGSINFQIGYPLLIEWVRHFHGEHTEPQYTRLSAEQLQEEGLSAADVAYRVTFMMKKDIAGLTALLAAGYKPEEARRMLEVSGLGTASASEYSGQYFAPNGRSKSWKVQKRAITDAYRRKFGSPNRSEIEELRRVGGFDNLRPEDWEATGGLSADSAQALAESAAHWRERDEAMETDPQYKAEQEAKTTEVSSSLWGGEIVEVPATEWSDEADAANNDEAAMDAAERAADEAEAAMIEELQAEADAGLPGTPATIPDDRPHWKSRAAAIAWAIAQGAFGEPDSGTAPHARNAFDKVKAEHNPENFAAMSDLWYVDVLRRISEKAPV